MFYLFLTWMATDGKIRPGLWRVGFHNDINVIRILDPNHSFLTGVSAYNHQNDEYFTMVKKKP
eukprot:UN12469